MNQRAERQKVERAVLADIQTVLPFFSQVMSDYAL